MGGSLLSKHGGIVWLTLKSLKILGKSIISIPLLIKGNFKKCLLTCSGLFGLGNSLFKANAEIIKESSYLGLVWEIDKQSVYILCNLWAGIVDNLHNSLCLPLFLNIFSKSERVTKTRWNLRLLRFIRLPCDRLFLDFLELISMILKLVLPVLTTWPIYQWGDPTSPEG